MKLSGDKKIIFNYWKEIYFFTYYHKINQKGNSYFYLNSMELLIANRNPLC